ncbi:unnamed protein product, partial [Leptidea sinapis]
MTHLFNVDYALLQKILRELLDKKLKTIKEEIVAEIKSSLLKQIKDEVKAISSQFNLIQESYQCRQLNIEIVGLPEAPNENPKTLMVEIAKHAGLQVSFDEIEFAHRVQPFKCTPKHPKALVTTKIYYLTIILK